MTLGRGTVLLLPLLLLCACGGGEQASARPAEAPAHPMPKPRSAAADASRGLGPPHSTGTSYEEALNLPEDMVAVANEPELTDAELAGPMRKPAFLGDCNAPDSMKLRVMVAVRDGAAIGVTVRTDPDDATVAECVDKAVRALAWKPTKRRESLTTSY